jgi:hypothetical protein
MAGRTAMPRESSTAEVVRMDALDGEGDEVQLTAPCRRA